MIHSKQKSLEILEQARTASRKLLHIAEEECNKILQTLAELLISHKEELIAENKKDLIAGKEKGLTDALLDRLTLTPQRIDSIAEGVLSVKELDADIGEKLSHYEAPTGIEVTRMRVPLGVICIIYESRPNVSIETSILALKSRNAIILKGGSEAYYSNAALVSLVQKALSKHDCNKNAVQLLGQDGREIVPGLISDEDGVDLVIPRGGEGLIRAISAQSRIPVLKHYKGVCHVYIDSAADLEKALPICINAKCQRPSVCNAAETLIIHETVAEKFLSGLGPALKQQKVAIRGDERCCELIPEATLASEEDWHAEYLDLIVAIRVVSSLDDAIAHINKYGSHHTDAILSEDKAALDRFTQEVDSGSVMRNTSTRFADGFEYGLGAELGISTDKIHARGPMGLEGLTTYKWVVESKGAIRQ